MMLFRLLLPFSGAHASRVISDNILNAMDEISDVTVVGNNEAAFQEEVGGGVTAWLKPLLEIVDSKIADSKFRTQEEPILVSGEVVEMAFHDGYRDWLLFTNWRFVKVAGEANMASGFGKEAIPNKITYSSKLWQKAMRHQSFVSVTTASSSLDRDVEVNVFMSRASPLPPVATTKFEFAKTIGDKGLLDIRAYLIGKIKKFGGRLQLNTCSELHERNGYAAIGVCKQGWQKMASLALKLSQLSLPGIGIVKEIPGSVDVLDGFSTMMEKDENVMYKFLETWSVSGRKDAMIVTDKQIVTVDRKLPSKVVYMSHPYPDGLSIDDMWPHFEEWEMETAARTNVLSRTCRLSATMTGLWDDESRAWHNGFKYELNFDKSAVPTPALHAYHTLLQQKVAASHKIR